uniref:EamA domain-containing protein n=1 Tax=Haptolina brevifila TaxID=156173 RepID=A0A7S2J0L2_9EUKA
MARLLLASVREDPSSWLCVSIPAGLYTVGAWMQFESAKQLNAGMAMVVMQSNKLFVAALSWWLLGTRLALRQWVALVILSVGIMVAVSPERDSSARHHYTMQLNMHSVQPKVEPELEWPSSSISARHASSEGHILSDAGWGRSHGRLSNSSAGSQHHVRPSAHTLKNHDHMHEKALELMLRASGPKNHSKLLEGSPVHHSTLPAHKNEVLGVLLILGAAFCSALASVYFELMIKRGVMQREPVSLWLFNVQLAAVSTLIATANLVLVPDPEGLFHHFNVLAWIVVLSGGMGGLFVAMVLKHADSILRGFASATSTVIVAIASHLILGSVLPPHYVLGTAMVLSAVMMYAGSCRGICSSSEMVGFCLGRSS